MVLSTMFNACPFRKIKLIRLWLPVLLWCGVIFFFSCLPSTVTPYLVWWDVLIKKTAHVTEYAILFILLFRALKQSFEAKYDLKNYKIMSLVFCALYAMSDEYHQRFTYGRTSTIRDVFIDIGGILLALYLVSWIKNKKGKLAKIAEFI